MRALLILAMTLLTFAPQPPRYSVVQDGEAHGDPPYLLEEGWEPLLNGKDLAGWKRCDAGAKNEWYTTGSCATSATSDRRSSTAGPRRAA